MAPTWFTRWWRKPVPPPPPKRETYRVPSDKAEALKQYLFRYTLNASKLRCDIRDHEGWRELQLQINGVVDSEHGPDDRIEFHIHHRLDLNVAMLKEFIRLMDGYPPPGGKKP